MKTTKPQKYEGRVLKEDEVYKTKAQLEHENEMLKVWLGYMEYKIKYYASQKVEFICEDLESAIKTIKNDLLTNNTSF